MGEPVLLVLELRPNVTTDLRDLDVNGKVACLSFIGGLATSYVECAEEIPDVIASRKLANQLQLSESARHGVSLHGRTCDWKRNLTT
jgi:hypothetical protein